MKLKERFKNWIVKPYSQMYVVVFFMYLIGAVADGLGFISMFADIVGFFLLSASMIAAIAFLVIWFRYDKKASILKTIWINICCIIISIILILIFCKLPMGMFVFTMACFLIANFIMLCCALLYAGERYYEACIIAKTSTEEEGQHTQDDTFSDNNGIGTII